MELGDDEVETGLATLLEEAHLNERWHLDAVPSAEEFVKEIQHLNPDKSGGPDGFHAGLLRPFGEEVGPMVQKVFNVLTAIPNGRSNGKARRDDTKEDWSNPQVITGVSLSSTS